MESASAFRCVMSSDYIRCGCSWQECGCGGGVRRPGTGRSPVCGERERGSGEGRERSQLCTPSAHSFKFPAPRLRTRFPLSAPASCPPAAPLRTFFLSTVVSPLTAEATHARRRSRPVLVLLLGSAALLPPSNRRRPAARPSRCSRPTSRRGRPFAPRCCRTTANGSPTCSRRTRATRTCHSLDGDGQQRIRSSRSAAPTPRSRRRRRARWRGARCRRRSARRSAGLALGGVHCLSAATTRSRRARRCGSRRSGRRWRSGRWRRADAAGAEQAGAGESRHRRKEGIRPRSSLRVQRRQADVARDAGAAEAPALGGQCGSGAARGRWRRRR